MYINFECFLQSYHSGIETGQLGAQIISLKILQSYHSGIETALKSKISLRTPTYNRTIVELKPKWVPPEGGFFFAYNRTIVELKLNKYFLF